MRKGCTSFGTGWTWSNCARLTRTCCVPCSRVWIRSAIRWRSSIRRICLRAPILLKKALVVTRQNERRLVCRTRKSNHGKWLVGYKKHTFRLWLANIAEQVVLVPLMSWATPAHRQDVLFLEPSLRYCRQHLEFAPGLVVADMAYIHLEMQRRVQKHWGWAS